MRARIKGLHTAKGPLSVKEMEEELFGCGKWERMELTHEDLEKSALSDLVTS